MLLLRVVLDNAALFPLDRSVNGFISRACFSSWHFHYSVYERGGQLVAPTA